MSKRIALLALSTAALAAPALAAPPFTTAPKSGAASSSSQARLLSVTVSKQATFDRIVFRFAGSRPGYHVRYVPKIVADGSGLPIPLAGSKKLSIVFQPARAHGAPAGSPTLRSTRTPSYPSLRQLKIAGDFEGVVSYGAGINGLKPFRVVTLNAPPRVVIEIRH